MSDHPELLNPTTDLEMKDSSASQSSDSSDLPDLPDLSDLSDSSVPLTSYSLLVCQYDNCLRNRSAQVLQTLQSIDLPDGVMVEAGGCQGQCHLGANVQVLRDGPSSQELPRSVWYCGVKPEDAETLVVSHCQDHQWVPRLLNPRLHPSF